LREIVTMGGGFFRGGNSTPVAEFNILCDPHAAEMVFRTETPKVLMPLDLTHQVLSTPSRIAKFRAVDTPVMQAAAQWLEFYNRHDVERYGEEGGPLHDPTVIGYLLKPTLFAGKTVPVTVEHGSPLTEGMTVFDWWSMTGKPATTTVMQRADVDGFYELLVERLSRYPL
jgi:purine nucleosidase